MNTINAISSADSHVNVNNLTNSETETSKFASSDVQNTASSVAESKPAAPAVAAATRQQDGSVAEVDTSTVRGSGTDAEAKPRVSTSGSPVRPILFFFVCSSRDLTYSPLQRPSCVYVNIIVNFNRFCCVPNKVVSIRTRKMPVLTFEKYR